MSKLLLRANQFQLSHSTYRYWSLHPNVCRLITAKRSMATVDPPTDATKSLFTSVHILGAGSIGLLLAATVRSAFPLQLLLRSKHATKINHGYVTLCMQRHVAGGTVKKLSPPTITRVPAVTIENMPQHKPIQNLLVTTKSYQAVSAIQSVVTRITETSTIVVLCNGALAVREEIQDYLTSIQIPCRVHVGMLTHGAYRDNTDSDDMMYVVWAGTGHMYIPDLNGMRLWDRARLHVTTLSTRDMETALWLKLAANCVINPLTAIHGVPNGALLHIPQFDSLEASLLHEVLQVQRAVNPLLTISYEQLHNFTRKVIHDTATNKSSMLQDVTSGRETEIQYLNHYIVEKGRAFNIDCPANESLVADIKNKSWNR
jgi:2-dehydropantoate 2-reductase